ncbi:MAG: methylaspartate mutase accessory protein GlmL [Rubrivivax sp.]
MTLALLVDFGSTYTKVRAVSLDEARVVATAQGPSTVGHDVTVGLQAALDRLHAQLGAVPRWRHRLAASSAAGGLRMVTVGLVRELTAEAARQAALGAGAKLVGSYAGRLTRADVQAIEATAPDVLLLCGGTDGGNRDTILHNAGVLARSGLACPIVVAGNREAADEVQDLLPAARIAGNVMPELNVLAIDPARAAIRDVFMQRIVHAKGIDRARALLDDVLMPTPAAVLEAAQLLSRGPGGATPGLGPLLVVDPGGATTDVHSIGDGEPTTPGAVRVGLPEPFAKRTVEGDLGMRHNAQSIVDAIGEEAFCRESGLAPARLRALLATLAADVERLPADDAEAALDRALGRCAIRLAMRRHAGTCETVYTTHGPVPMQRGKDLGGFGTVIGTGGVLVAAQRPGELLAAVRADPARPQELCPRAPRFLVDRDYVLYAAGLLAALEPQAAFALACSSLQPASCDGPTEEALPTHG